MKTTQSDFGPLLKFLSELPPVEQRVDGLPKFGFDFFSDGGWWVKFSLDIEHELAWSVVQELGFALNYISVSEKLPTRFMPVSPPPYLNGGPKEYLSWVIECEDSSMTPLALSEILRGRLPRPLDDREQWPVLSDEE